MRAVKLPNNPSPLIVEMRYRPMSWRVGSTMAIIAWGLFAILALMALVMRGLRLRGG